MGVGLHCVGIQPIDVRGCDYSAISHPVISEISALLLFSLPLFSILSNIII